MARVLEGETGYVASDALIDELANELYNTWAREDQIVDDWYATEREFRPDRALPSQILATLKEPLGN